MSTLRVYGTLSIELLPPAICIAVRRSLGLALVALSLAVSPLHGQKTDVVILENGDHVTGEIKELTRGRLSYSTDDMGTISIEWERVQRITSSDFFQVELSSGERYFGQLAPADQPRWMVITVAEFTDIVPMGSVVRIIPIEASFWQRLDGYIDLGFSFQQANLVTELSLTSQVKYRTRKTFNVLDGEVYFQKQKDASETTRSSLGTQINRFVARKWTVLGAVDLEQNRQTNLDLRITAGAGGSHIFTQTNNGLLRTIAGLQWTNERFVGTEGATNNLEAAISAQGEYYLFDSPKTDITSTLSIKPNLTDFGRVRIDFDARASHEIVSDFTIGLTVFEKYDSRSPSTGKPTNDFGTTLSVGYKF